jgi:hypothetical protein
LFLMGDYTVISTRCASVHLALDLLRSPQPPPLKPILAALIDDWEEHVNQPCVAVGVAVGNG